MSDFAELRVEKFTELREDGWGQFPSDVSQDISELLYHSLGDFVDYLERFDDFQCEDGIGHIFLQFKPEYGEGKAYKIVVEPTEGEED